MLRLKQIYTGGIYTEKIAGILAVTALLALVTLSSCSDIPQRDYSASVITAGPDVVSEIPEVTEDTKPVTTVTEEPETDHIGDILSSMSLHEKVCQLFIVTPEQLTETAGSGGETVTVFSDAAADAVKEYPVAGIILFNKNLCDRQQITDMNNGFSGASEYGFFIAVDEEGGDVARLESKDIEGITELNSMAWYGRQEDAPEQFTFIGHTLGSELRDLGFNLNFAPVADIGSEYESAMGRRMAGSDPEYVGTLISNEVSAMQSENVCASLKHFPGLGATYSDTHYGNAVLSRTREELDANDFIPFRKGIQAGAEFVMVSHAIAEGLGQSVPSDLSEHVVTEILRNDLGFNGIIITDAHSGMASITDNYSPAEASVAAVRAGADIVLSPESLSESVNALEEACSDDSSLCQQIDESVRRILSVKQKYGIIRE